MNDKIYDRGQTPMGLYDPDPWGRRSPAERYEHDPVFHQLVDLLESMLYRDDMRNYTPSDLREACMLAAARYEALRVRPSIMSKEVRSDNPPVGKCVRCNRRTWAVVDINSVCNTPLPDGTRCDGTFHKFFKSSL